MDIADIKKRTAINKKIKSEELFISWMGIVENSIEKCVDNGWEHVYFKYLPEEVVEEFERQGFEVTYYEDKDKYKISWEEEDGR